MSTERITALCNTAEFLLQMRDETSGASVRANDADCNHYWQCNSHLNLAWEHTMMALKSYIMATTPDFPHAVKRAADQWKPDETYTA